MKQIVNKYIRKGVATPSLLKQFAEECFLEKLHRIDSENSINIMLKTWRLPNNTNGAYINLRFMNSIIININIFSICNLNVTENLKYFYVYLIICHEIEHHLDIVGSKKNICDLIELISFFENSFFPKRFYIEKIIYDLFYRSYKRKRYLTAASEIVCEYSSMNEAYKVFEFMLSADEDKYVCDLVNSLTFIRKNCEIAYYMGDPVNRVYKMLDILKKYGKWNYKKMFIENHCLKYLFDENGNLKKMLSIFEARNEENSILVDQVLIELFILCDTDLTTDFNINGDFFRYIEELANNYCSSSIEYIRKRKVASAYWTEDIINDNTLLIVKNVTRLNKLMIRYNMEQVGGSIIA